MGITETLSVSKSCAFKSLCQNTIKKRKKERRKNCTEWREKLFFQVYKMSTNENKDTPEVDKVGEKDCKQDKRDGQLQSNLQTTTSTSTFFFLTKFNSEEIFYEEKLPKNFEDLENLLNKVLVSLEETENVFVNQAKAVLDRDLTLINWRIRLKNLQNNLKEKKQEFERIDQTVECILKLSVYIDKILVRLEKDMPGISLVNNAFKFTPARMTMYDSMIKINITQRDMLQQILNAVLSINETIEYNPSDPVEQFMRILSLHTEVLRTIERRAKQMEEQLRVVKSLHEFYTSTKKPMMCDYC